MKSTRLSAGNRTRQGELPVAVHSQHTRHFKNIAITIVLFLAGGCGSQDSRTVITIWHQSRPTEKTFLEREIARFEKANPTIHVRALYKETEELRSGFQAAALAGGGPELIFGPSDVLGALQTMGVVQDMSPWFPTKDREDFVDGALTYLPANREPHARELVPDRGSFRESSCTHLQPTVHQRSAKDDRRVVRISGRQHGRRKWRWSQGPLRARLEFYRAIFRNSVPHRFWRLGV